MENIIKKFSFGIIIGDCTAIIVNGPDSSRTETVKAGTLIQIISEYQERECQFKIWNFSSARYETTTFKCLTQDYITVAKHSFPYVIAIKNDEGRIKFVQNVNSGEFDLNLLSLGHDIRIRAPTGANVSFYDFVVTYIGGVEKNRVGFYVGLKWKNDEVELPTHLSYLTQNYQFGGSGIVAPVDWIMQNLYKTVECHSEAESSTKDTLERSSTAVQCAQQINKTNVEESFKPVCSESIDISPNEVDFDMTKNQVENVQILSMSNEDPKKVQADIEKAYNVIFSKPNDMPVCESAAEPPTPQMHSIDQNITPPKLPYQMQMTVNKTFGIISREFIGIDVASLDDSNGEKLKPGTLIQIIPEHQVSGCYFKIRDFTNWADKYKTTVYKCTKDDYIVVTKTLWPYLVALINLGDRIEFVRNVYRGNFDMNMLSVGRKIRIRPPIGVNVKFLEFLVTYNGVVPQYNSGYYIGLQLMNKQVSLPTSLSEFTQNYRFGGTGIVVSALWIMLNLYDDEKCLQHTITRNNENKSNEKMDLKSQPGHFEESFNKGAINNKSRDMHKPSDHSYRRYHQGLKDKTKDTGAIRKTIRHSPERKFEAKCEFNQSDCTAEIELVNNSDGAVNNAEETNCELCNEVVKIGCGIILRECLHTFCKSCISSYIKQNSKNSKIRCPYNKEYKCEFDLWDAEIKDLGGMSTYNKILDNRLNEFIGTDPNARVCLNENCKNVWVGARTKPSQNEQCPKCKSRWSNVSESQFGSSEKQFQNSGKPKNKNMDESRNGSEQILRCAKCSKLTKCVKLQNCPHTFCKDCVVPMINMQMAKSQYAHCEICKIQLDVTEITGIIGIEVLNLIIANRESQPECVSTINIICCCDPKTTTKCVTVLNCNHQFCRTYLKNIVQQQIENKRYPTCPICLVEILDYQDKLDTVECQICSNQTNIRLKICGHSFCKICARKMMANQARDPNEIRMNCKVCNDPVTDSDILQYGGQEIFYLFKSKILFATRPLDSIDSINLNDWPVRCVLCQNEILIKNCIILDGCRDIFCHTCFKQYIYHQLLNAKTLQCPNCQRVLKQFERDLIFGKHTTNKPNDNTNLVECERCKGQFKAQLNYKSSCPFCEIRVSGESQTATERHVAPMLQTERNINHNEMSCTKNHLYKDV